MNPDAISPSPPVISVIIPAYNCQVFIVLTVRSLQAQTFKDWECVIIDDGSKDETLSVIRGLAAEDPRIRVATQPNAGPSSARNHGLRLIDPRSRYVSFMDSDDVWMPEALAALKAEVEKFPDAVGAHCRGRCIDKDGNVYVDPMYAANGNGRFISDAAGRIIQLDPAIPTSFQSLWFSNPYPPGLILTRRSAYDKVGSFDATLCPVEDWDMVIRLSRYGSFHFLDRVLLSYRRHPNNLSGQSDENNVRQIRAVLHKTFYSPENDPTQRRITRRNWRASEMLHLRQKLDIMKEQFAKYNFRGVFTAIAGVCMHLFRFARGYPSRISLEAVRSSFLAF